MLYCVPVFNTISLTGDYLKVDFEKLIPASCEVSLLVTVIAIVCAASLETLLFPYGLFELHGACSICTL